MSRNKGIPYSVGIICALDIELAAVAAMFDEKHPNPPLRPGDNTTWTLGKLGDHGVVVACLPETGLASAAVAAEQMLQTFPIRIGLVVGIGGGIWSPQTDIRLGDVVVSTPEGQHGGVVHWRAGKLESTGVFQRTGTLNKPPRVLLSAVKRLSAEHLQDRHKLDKHYRAMLERKPEMAEEYLHPGRENDNLFNPSCEHVASESYCASCPRSEIIPRKERLNDLPKIHYGNFASDSVVVKDSNVRDYVAAHEKIIGFETEAAGVMDTFPCIIIRGISDYADSHKNDKWRHYAAAMAAAYAKDLLLSVSTQTVHNIPKVVEVISPNPQIIDLPFSENLKFVGRQKELGALDLKLYTARDCRRLSVVGLGGTGKTQTALKFAWQVAEKYTDVSIFWMSAVSLESLERSFERLAERLGISTESERNGQQKTDVKPLVKSYLSDSSAGKWLLVVDNVDDLAALGRPDGRAGPLQSLPESSQGATIFTTRAYGVAQRLTGSDIVEVKELLHEDATKLLELSISRQSIELDPPSVTSLLVELEHLPMAIIQASAYMNVNDVSVAEFLKLFLSREEDRIHLMSDDRGTSMQYEGSFKTIATLFIMSFEQIAEQDPHAAEILDFISNIEWKAIPHSILPVIRPKARMMSAVGLLCSYAFLTKLADESVYDMHRLVHLASRIWLKKKDRHFATQTNALRHLARLLPARDQTHREVWRRCSSHAICLGRDWLKTRASADRQLDPPLDQDYLHEFVSKVAYCLMTDGKVAEAALFYVLQDCHSERWESRDHLPPGTPAYLRGQELMNSGNAQGAIRQLESSYRDAQRVLPLGDSFLLRIRLGLAEAYAVSGQSKLATAVLDDAIVDEGKTAHTGSTLDCWEKFELATERLKLGKSSAALTLLEEASAMTKESVPEAHALNFLTSLSLAKAYFTAGQSARAITLLDQAVATDAQLVAVENKYRLQCHLDLVQMYWHMDQAEKSIELLERTIAMLKRSTPMTDHLTLEISQILAYAHIVNGQRQATIQFLKRAAVPHVRIMPLRRIGLPSVNTSNLNQENLEMLDHLISLSPDDHHMTRELRMLRSIQKTSEAQADRDTTNTQFAAISMEPGPLHVTQPKHDQAAHNTYTANLLPTTKQSPNPPVHPIASSSAQPTRNQAKRQAPSSHHSPDMPAAKCASKMT